MKLAIRHISLQSLGKTGCVLGVALALLPSLLCGIAGVAIVQVVRHWMEGWQQIKITILDQEIATIDLVQRLGLTEFLERLQTIGDASWLVVALVVLGLGLLVGLALALIIIAAGLVYNLLASATGGVVVDAAIVSRQPASSGEQLVLKRREPAARRKD